MTTNTPRRMSLPPVLADKEGQRIPVPEGGELVCYRNAEQQRLFLKIEYSRETMVKLSASIFCHQRPSGLAQLARESPELLGCPQKIPEHSAPPQVVEVADNLNNFNFSPRIFSPLRGPITAADESMRSFTKRHHNHLDFNINSPLFD